LQVSGEVAQSATKVIQRHVHLQIETTEHVKHGADSAPLILLQDTAAVRRPDPHSATPALGCCVNDPGVAMRAREFVSSYFDAWNHRDPKAIADHLDANGVYRDIPEAVQRTHDELIVTLGEFFATYRHRYELVGQIMKGRDTIAFQYRMCPVGTDRRAGPIRGAEFITLHGDAAISIVDYYDLPDVDQTVPKIAAGKTQRIKYAKSGLTDEQMEDYKAQLATMMDDEQAYLRPNLTLPRLARTIDCSVNHLSQVINAGFGMSFFDYLNSFRVDHAKRLLTEMSGHENAVLDVAFAVGFNSNSAFYTAFKKRVGQTPAQFRRSKSNSTH
jgi:AraC-like DNA-binding protein